MCVNVIYKSPSYQNKLFLNYIENTAEDLSKHKNLVMMGDYNINLLNKSIDSQDIFNIASSNKLQVLNHLIPTRVTLHLVSVIDIVMSNMKIQEEKESKNIYKISDHELIINTFLGYNMDSKKTKFKNKNDIKNIKIFNKINYEMMKTDLKENMNTCCDNLCSTSIDEESKKFSEIIKKCVEKNIPIKQINCKKHNKNTNNWYKNTEIRKISKRVNIEWSKYLLMKKRNVNPVECRRQFVLVKLCRNKKVSVIRKIRSNYII